MNFRKMAALLAACCLLFAVGCADVDTADGEDKLTIISTVFAPYDFAREVAGERADCSLLVPPGTEVHGYEPTARDMIAVQECDVFIYVGGESAAWVTTLLSALDTSRIKLVTLMDCVELLHEEELPGLHDHDHDEEAHEEAYDEHVWTSPRNAALITDKLAAAFAAADPAGAELYAANAAAYKQELSLLDAAFETVVNAAVRRTLVMADRFPLLYFARAYDLGYYAAFPGCASETEPSAATVAFLIDKVKAEGIPVVLCLEMSNGRMADTICEGSGAKKRTFHSCHNLTKDEMEAGETYLSLMYHNRDVLKEALS